MRPIVTPVEMAAADRRAIDAGTPEPVLVERAGRAVAWDARRLLGGCYGRRVVVLAGKEPVAVEAGGQVTVGDNPGPAIPSFLRFRDNRLGPGHVVDVAVRVDDRLDGGL